MKTSKSQDELARTLEEDLLNFYQSPIISGEQLRLAMGYKSIQALRKALTRGVFPVAVFTIENRTGRFALVKDVAQWLAAQRVENQEANSAKSEVTNAA